MSKGIATQIKKLFKWARPSLIGHVVVFELFFSIPMGLGGLFTNYVQGTLTLPWAIYVFVIAAALGAVLGVVIRYAVTLPIMKCRGERL